MILTKWLKAIKNLFIDYYKFGNIVVNSFEEDIKSKRDLLFKELSLTVREATNYKEVYYLLDIIDIAISLIVLMIYKIFKLYSY